MKIVGIGASAGGVEAVRDFLSHLAPDTGAAFVVVQHTPDDTASAALALLAEPGGMPVTVLEASAAPRPNHIYLKAADKDLWFEQGMLLVGPRVLSEPVYLPVDRLFLSLAQTLDQDAVAVILSGRGDDGSRGARYIKEQGGTVLVQSPESALYLGMPSAVLGWKAADLAGTPAELAAGLSFLLKHRQPGWERKEGPLLGKEQRQVFVQLLRHIRELAGINFLDYEEAHLLRRMEKGMLLRQQTSLREYGRRALRDEQALRLLYDDFLSSATSFFRNRETFQKLRELVLPQILRPGTTRPIRIWVPACATGEEAYSLAIIIEEYLREERLQLDYKIFASDIDREAIRFAGEGRYPYTIAADVPGTLLSRYFEREAQGCRVGRRLRERILFAVQNTLEAPPFTRLDLISCRHFLTLLKEEARRRVLTTFHFALEPEGYLLLGAGENLGGLRHAFATVNRQWSIYQKREAVRPPAGDTAPLPAGGRQLPEHRLRDQADPFEGNPDEKLPVDPEQLALLRQRIDNLERELRLSEEKTQELLRQMEATNVELGAARRDLLALLNRPATGQ